jgi:hypothetical protein
VVLVTGFGQTRLHSRERTNDPVAALRRSDIYAAPAMKASEDDTANMPGAIGKVARQVFHTRIGALVYRDGVAENHRYADL